MKEKILKSTGKGLLMLLVSLIMLFGGCGLIVYGGTNELSFFIAGGVILMLLGFILIIGIKVVRPQEAVVYTLFGKYIGTLKEEGFHFINPFATSFNPAAHTRLGQSGDVKSSINMDAAMGKKISLKAMTLSNSKQKVNDALGNPVEVGVAVIWKVVDTAAAVFNVDNFKEYLSLQCDTSVRDIVKLYNALASWAEDDFRSLNGQIEYLLTECVKQRKKDGKYVGESIDEPIELDIE